MTDEPRRRRTTRAARAPRSTAHHTQLRNPFAPAEVFSADQVEHLHQQALTLLEEFGLKVLLPEARARLAVAGAAVDEDTQMVRLDRGLVTAAVATAPAEFDLVARNPAHSVRIGGDHVMVLPVGGPPYVSDLRRGRRPGTMADFETFAKLAQRTDVLHAVSPAVEPQDIDLRLRNLRVGDAGLTLSDKPMYANSRGRASVEDSFEMCRLALGIDEATFLARPHVWTNINTNSPRQLDVPMCLGIIDFAAAGQVCIMTPFTLSGAMAPVSLAGALLLQHAEALAAITLSQVVRPGAPVVYGAFTSNVDMRSGAPAFGTPEAGKAAIASGQLARHLGLPWRSQAASTSNVEDAQGGYETMVSMMACVMGGANVVLHAAGWQEGGLTASLEKFVLDVEMLRIVAEMFQPVPMEVDDLAAASIGEVAPGGHFFGTAHTLERFESAFHEPTVFTRQNFGQWTDGGATTAAQRATAVWELWLETYEQPPMPDDCRAALDEFVARRVAEGGIAAD